MSSAVTVRYRFTTSAKFLDSKGREASSGENNRKQCCTLRKIQNSLTFFQLFKERQNGRRWREGAMG